MKLVTQILILLTVILGISCSITDASKSDDSIKCKSPRPQLCTMDYNPVCATRDNGVRCATTPCSSTETATYSNRCSACADKNVFSYVLGECKE
jgi:hypothetical protein